jgi:hypothetical protein
MNIAGINVWVEISASQASNWIFNSEKILLDDSIFDWNVTVFKARRALSKGEILSTLNYGNHSLAFSWVQLTPVVCIMDVSLCIVSTVFLLVVFKIHLEIVWIRVSCSHLLSEGTNIRVISKLLVFLAKKSILDYTTALNAFVGVSWVFLQWQNIPIDARCRRKNCSTA